MKTKILLGTAIMMAQALSAGAQESSQLGKALLNEVIRAMTIEEKVDLLVSPWHVGNESEGSNANIGIQGDIVPGTTVRLQQNFRLR